MVEFYPQIKFIHISSVILSGSLFTLRGLMMLVGSRRTNHIVLRYLSYIIDMTLLTAALMLVVILHQYPFVHAWLTAKVLLLAIYIVLGSLALKRGRTQRSRAFAFAAALMMYGLIISIAMAHHPLGAFAPLLEP